MSAIAAVGLQVATGTLLTYPYELCDLTYKANYQPLASSSRPVSDSTDGSLRLTSLYATLKHHLFTSPQGAFELFRGIVPYLFYTITFSTFFPAYFGVFRSVVPLPRLGPPTGVVWKDALPLEAHQTLAVSTWRVLLQPLTTLFYRVLLAPESRQLAPLLPSPRKLWTAATQRTSVPHISASSSSSSSNEKSAQLQQELDRAADRIGSSGTLSLFLPSVSALEFSHGIVSGAANLFLAQAGLPILTLLAPQHFPPSAPGFAVDLLTAAAWAVGGVALRLSALALRTVTIRLSVQDTASPGAVAQEAHAETGASVVRLRPEPYRGGWDAIRSVAREEGAAALVRGWGVALFLDVFAVTTTLAMAAGSIPQAAQGPAF